MSSRLPEEVQQRLRELEKEFDDGKQLEGGGGGVKKIRRGRQRSLSCSGAWRRSSHFAVQGGRGGLRGGRYGRSQFFIFFNN